MQHYRADGQRVALRENGTLHYLLTDHPTLRSGRALGSTAITASSSGGKHSALR